MINVNLRDPHLLENVKAIKDLKVMGNFTDDELQDMYYRQLISDREKDISELREEDSNGSTDI